MNAERLLTHYERIADAPDAVARLRKFILDLAVRGKLVRQDPSDEPASELLRRIQAEKNARNLPIRLGTTSIEKRLPPGWEVVALADFALDVSTGPFGSALHQSDYVVGGVPLVNPSHMIGDRIVADESVSVSKETAAKLSSYVLRAGDVVMARRGEVGRAALVEFHQNSWLCGTGSFVVRFTDEVDRSFFLLLLRTTDLRQYLAGKAVGSTMVNLNHNILKGAQLPIPPLAEQKRIVAKVDELKALCDRLETSRSEREAKRDRLTSASLARLNAPDPDSELFAKHARFAIDKLSALAARPDQIKQLRRTILNLAVRGRLVAQDPKDEPAEELLTRIALEKARLVKAGEIRKPKLSEPIREDELPIEVPKNWAWARLCEIGNLSGGMTPSMNRSDYWDGHIIWLSPKDIKSDEVANSELKISALGLAETRLELYRPGCLFMVARSGILKRTFPVSINRVPAAANQDLKVLAPFLLGQERYLQIMFRGLMDFLLRELVKTGTTVQSLKYAEFEQQPFPLPPLTEQRRIVEKVNELMAVCDRLESRLNVGAAARGKLLDALIADALSPAAKNAEAA